MNRQSFSDANSQTFRLRQLALFFVEGEELLRTQVESRRHVENVRETVACLPRVAIAQFFGKPVHRGPVDRSQVINAPPQILGKVGTHRIRLGSAETPGAVVFVKPHLEMQ